MTVATSFSDICVTLLHHVRKNIYEVDRSGTNSFQFF